MGWTAAQMDAAGAVRAAEVRATLAAAARRRRLEKRAAMRAADPSIKFKQATKAEFEQRQAGVLDLIKGMDHPVTVRQMFYAATVAGLIDKTELGYQTISRDLTDLRESEDVPWDWITDNTRRVIEYQMFDNIAGGLNHLAQTFTRDPWCDADEVVAIWMEKDALAGVIETITLPLGVPLFVLKGFGSLSFIKEAADRFNERSERTVHHYHLGDFDPSGRRAGISLRDKLEQFTDGDMEFTTLALHSIEQTKGLPSRPTKVADNNLEWFVREYGTDRRIKTLDRDLARIEDKKARKDYLLELSPDSVELDAMEPDALRALVRGAIMRHTTARRIKQNERLETEIQERLMEIAAEEEGV